MSEPTLIRVIAHFDGADITEWSDGSIQFWANADVDDDGPGKRKERDPDHDDQTSLRYQGESIDSTLVPGTVIPGSIIDAVPGVFLGCKSTVNGIAMVCYDVGPRTKLGEVSVAGAELLHINPSPVSGGDARRNYLYIFYPGVPATVNGVTYDLQPH